MVVVSTACASVCYAVLASSVIAVCQIPFQNLDTANSILDLTTMSGQVILLAVGGPIAASFSGSIVSLIFTQDPSGTYKSMQERQFIYRFEPEKAPLIGMNQVIIATNGTTATKIIAIALRSYATSELSRRVGSTE